MKFFSFASISLACFLTVSPARADSSGVWRVTSPDHGQTFAYGSEQNRVWAQRDRDRHLAVLLNFTNDPYVDRLNPRQYDNFVFHFPGITLGKHGKVFFYHAPNGDTIPVAIKRPDFFGVEEIHLFPNASLMVEKPHGYLTLTLAIGY